MGIMNDKIPNGTSTLSIYACLKTGVIVSS